MRNALFALSAGTLALTLAAPAAANGRFPASNDVELSPSDPNFIVARTTYGILLSHDAGATWTWLCEDVLGLPPVSNQDPAVGVTQTNALVAGSTAGLRVSTDVGCNWSPAAGSLGQSDIRDLVVRPDAPHTVLVLASTYGGDAGADGGVGYETHVFKSTDDGATWAPLGAPIDPSVLVSTIEVAASDPNRIYVAGVRGEAASRTGMLLESTDQGTTWTEHPTPLDPKTEVDIFIGGVDPTNPDRVYLRSQGMSRLIVTSDGGKTFTVPLTLANEMQGFALSSDGSRVYAGSSGQGLFEASSQTLTFQNIAPNLHVQCLRTHGNELWACADEPSGFIVGVSTDGAQTFAPKLHLFGIQSPVVCGGDASAQMCTTPNPMDTPPYDPFQLLCASLGACYQGDAGLTLLQLACIDGGVCPAATLPDGGSNPKADAGGSSSGADAGDGGAGRTPSAPAPRSSCGCSVAGGGSAAGIGAALMIAAVGVRRRRGTGRARTAGR